MPRSNLVYTTSGSNVCSTCGKSLRRCKCQCAPERALTSAIRAPLIQLQKKGRAGKEVTVISNLGLSRTDLLDLLKILKKSLGTGGTLKDQTLEIHGNRTTEATKLLSAKGIKPTKI